MIKIEEIQKKYGTEIALVVLCCRVHFGTENQTILEQFIGFHTIDWNHFKLLADYHRIEPIVFKPLGEIKNIPDVIATDIKQKQFFLIHQSFQRAIETERLIGILNANNIRCIPYKGIVFSKQFYGDITSRESSDIDFIITPSDFDKVLRLMQQDGYSFEQEDEYAYFGKAIFSRQKELNFNKYKDGKREFHVEFHWRISDNVVQLEKEAHTILYETTYSTQLVKNEVQVLNKSAHYLAVFIHHSNNDTFGILRNITDLCLLKNNIDDDSNIQYITDALSRFRLIKAAALCYHLSWQLLGVQVPFGNNLTGINISEKTIQHFSDYLLKKELIGQYQTPKFYNKSVSILMDNSWRKMLYLIACISLRFQPSAKDLRIFKFPRTLHFLYFIVKPIRSAFSRSDHEEEKNVAMQNSKRGK